ncbi:TetR family transcriptional regulator [Amycolatopsis sp. NPDC004079]|uniref:TetR/AcrR family transcriptional regulator n=1 Tax=Amycolatopsis halotolerans TaxID=330083 RepID=A0ABV7QC10_9PSEU
MTSTAPLGLRERKKRAARRALAEAALRIALERGVEQLRVEDIANEVGVSPRTFNNYFSSKEEAVCAFIVERQERVREALLARPADEPLWEAVVNASITRFAEDDRPIREDVRRVRAMMENGGLFGEMLRAYATVERVLADAIAERAGEHANPLHARLMASIVQNASRIAFDTWLNSDSDDKEFVSAFTGLLREAAAGMPALAASGAAR